MTCKIFSGPAPCEKATAQSEILDLGFHNSLVQHDMCPTIRLKNHSTL